MKHLCSSLLLYCIFLSAFNIINATKFMPYPCKNGKQSIINADSIFSYTSSDTLRMDNYYYPTNCSVSLVPLWESEGFVISVKKLDIGLGSLIFNDKRKSTSLSGYMSYPDEKFVFASAPGATLVVTYNGPSTFISRSFELVYTVYRSSVNCSSSRALFNCDNRRCIAVELQCDGHNHCGDRSDQRCNLSLGATLGCVFGSIFVVISIICFVVFLKRRRAQQQGSTTRLQGTTIIPTQPPPGYYMPPPPTQHMVNPVQFQGNQGQTVHVPPPSYVPPKY